MKRSEFDTDTHVDNDDADHQIEALEARLEMATVESGDMTFTSPLPFHICCGTVWLGE